jgi:hypothetical protein
MLNQVVVPIITAVPVILPFLKQVNTGSGYDMWSLRSRED